LRPPDTYKRLLLAHGDYAALGVYVALCYSRLDYHDTSQVGGGAIAGLGRGVVGPLLGGCDGRQRPPLGARVLLGCSTMIL
jgi:hypothetical protein